MDEEAVLLVVTHDKDENGFPVESLEEIPIWVQEKSTTWSEFYAALREGINARIVFEARQEDFELSAHYVNGKKEYATRIRHDGSTYDIIRAYRKGKAMIELTCG